jgi:DNA-binding NarL/FixJ family response regulator
MNILPQTHSTLRVLLIEEQPLVRLGLSEVLRSINADCQISECGTAKDAWPLLATGNWDLIILNMSLPDGQGTELIVTPWARKVLLLTSRSNALLTRTCREKGAGGYICKTEPPHRILVAIRSVLDGGDWYPDISDLSDTKELSERELFVMKALVTGSGPLQIAKELNITRSSVQSYKERIFRKFDVSSTAELVRKALDLGM